MWSQYMEFILFSHATAKRYVLSLLWGFSLVYSLRLFPFYEGSLIVCQVSNHIVCPALIGFTWLWLTCLSPSLGACVSCSLCQSVACYLVCFCFQCFQQLCSPCYSLDLSFILAFGALLNSPLICLPWWEFLFVHCFVCLFIYSF